MFQTASDWALRRLLKVALKRNLKHVLATELDVDQLRVSLGTGALELTDVLISPDWLAEHTVRLATGWLALPCVTKKDISCSVSKRWTRCHQLP